MFYVMTLYTILLLPSAAVWFLFNWPSVIPGWTQSRETEPLGITKAAF